MRTTKPIPKRQRILLAETERGRSRERSHTGGPRLVAAVDELRRRVRRKVLLPTATLEVLSKAVAAEKQSNVAQEDLSDSSSSSSSKPGVRTNAVVKRAAHQRKLNARERRREKDFVKFMETSTTQSFLEHRSVTVTVARNYARCANLFLDYCQDRKLKLDGVRKVDAAMVEYLNHLYMRGHYPSAAEYAVAGFLHKVPEYGGHGMAKLARTTRCLKGF